jgi:hypothetical protein
VECPSLKDLEVEHLVTLKVLCGEIKRGEKTIEEVFGSPLDKEIDALLTQLGKNASQSRMLRESYKGRPKELLDYLRGQLTPQTSKVAAATEDWVAQKSTPAFNEKQAEQAAPVEVKRGRGRPSREEMARRKAAEEAAAAQQSLASAEPPVTEDIRTEDGAEGHDQEDSEQKDAFGLV